MAKPVVSLDPYEGSMAWTVNGEFVCWDFTTASTARDMAVWEHCCGSPRKEDNLNMVADEIDRRRGRG